MEDVFLGEGDGAALALKGELGLEFLSFDDFRQSTDGGVILIQR